MSVPSFKAFRVGEATLENVRTMQMYVDYVIITDIPTSFFPFSSYGKGVYYMTLDNVYQIRDPAFLFSNKLIKDKSGDFKC